MAREHNRRERDVTWRKRDAMNFTGLATLLLGGMFGYSAWLTSVVFCAANGQRPLLVADALFFPVGIIHGIGIWLGGW